MTIIKRSAWALALLVSASGLSFAPLTAQTTLTTVGPDNGSLVIVGGALRDVEIFERFIALAGGPDAPIVVIPTAGGADTLRLVTCFVDDIEHDRAKRLSLSP